MSADTMAQMRLAFRAEALELLHELDESLLALETRPADSDLVNRVFRAIHTIKGSGATAGYLHLARFVHRLEEAFDLARGGRLAVTTPLIDCGLKACDVIRLILDSPEDAGEAQGEQAVGEALARLLPDSAAGSPALETGPARPASGAIAYEIVFRPNRALFASGTDPVTLLDELRSLGPARITARDGGVPLLGALEAESCYLFWEILLLSGCGQPAIRDVFLFVEDDCEITIRELADQASAVALLASFPAASLETFALECEDQLAAMESHALVLERDAASRESLDALFRNVHSLKGNAGLLLGEVRVELPSSHPLQLLRQVAHALESLLDSQRESALSGPPDSTSPIVERAVVETALETCDAMRALLDGVLRQAPSVTLPPSLWTRLGLTAPGHHADGRLEAFTNTATQCLELLAACQPQLAAGGSILETCLRALKTLEAAAAYQQSSEVREPVAEQLQLLEAAMTRGGGLEPLELERFANSLTRAGAAVDLVRRGASPPLASAKLESLSTSPSAVASSTSSAAAPPAAAPATIRIEQEKLDRLMRVVGELLVARGVFPVLAQRLLSGDAPAPVGKELKEAGASISRIADELQNSVMSIRMLPVKTVFQKFPRLVRDLAKSLGKEVQFRLEGENIELDKTILEQIGDPLVHLIRNAVDHGLEAPDERARAGKSTSGHLTLRAINEAGSVVIQVADDGPGLDAARLKRKAVEKGLLAAEDAAALTDSEAFQLIFLPGLSTAARVTDVSGRGVGMDVVRNNIRNLHGTIEIDSRPGLGTTFSVTLPTSLMVSKGILLEAGGETYVLPLGYIRDMVKMPAGRIHCYHGMSVVEIRGDIYPVYELAALFGLKGLRQRELPVVLVEAGSTRYGLIVDRFVNEVEVIVKPLSGGLEACREFQGAAILGDGRVVLVLNAQECHHLERAR